MNERQKRLIEVYEHLRRYFGIHTKTGFAEALHYGRTSMSAAMNGDEKYLTNKLFENICAAYRGTFNLDYLLTGNGSLLTIEEEVRISDIEKTINQEMLPQPVFPKYVQDLCDQAAKVAARCEILEMQLSKALADNRELKEKLNLSLVSLDGMKQQLASVLQVFRSPNALNYYNNVLQGGMVSESKDV